MWKVLLLLLALGVIFVILLRFLERWSQRSKIASRPRRELDTERGEEGAEEEEGQAEGHIDDLVQELGDRDAHRAREAAAKLLMIGPGVIARMMPAFLRSERGRRGHELAVVARRFEDTLTSFGPVAVKPCLELMAAEKGSFEIFRGLRAVVTGIGEAAARPLIEAIVWLAQEGLYVRAAMFLKALGPGALSPLLRALEGGGGHARELCTDLLLDYCAFHPQAVAERVRATFTPGARRAGLAASADVRYVLLLAQRRIGVAAAELEPLREALDDEDPRVRRESWLALGELPEAAATVAARPLEVDEDAAAAQVYALDRQGVVLPPDDRPGRVATARAGARARRGDLASLAALEAALIEGPLEVRREAAEALAHAGGDEAARILARGLAKTPVPILGPVAMALARTRSEAAAAALFELWEERAGNTLRRAVAELGERRAPKLTEYVARRSPRLMEPAALVLGGLGAPARQALLALLPQTRRDDPALFAVEIALEAQGAAAVEDVLSLLESSETHVVELAVWVLSQCGDPRAAEPLLLRLGDLDDRYPVLDYVRRGSPEVQAVARRFVESHPEHPDGDALRQAIGG